MKFWKSLNKIDGSGHSFNSISEVNDVVFRAMATELDKNIEFLSNVLYFVVAKVSIAGVVLPPAIVTTINHFIYDLEDEAYVLAFPTMYVHQNEIFRKKFNSFYFKKGCHSIGKRPLDMHWVWFASRWLRTS